MHKLAKNRTLLIVFVVIMIIGLVAIYVPAFFTPPPLYRESESTPEDEYATPPLVPVEPSTSTPDAEIPSGFSGLNEEGQSLDNLDGLLGE